MVLLRLRLLNLGLHLSRLDGGGGAGAEREPSLLAASEKVDKRPDKGDDEEDPVAELDLSA